MWWAFALNFVTGVLLFMADATTKAGQRVFYVKLALIALACSSRWPVRKRRRASTTASTRQRHAPADARVAVAVAVDGGDRRRPAARLPVARAWPISRSVRPVAQATPLSLWINQSTWIWPLCETLHFIGLSLLLGITGFFDLRLMGFFKRVPVAAARDLMPLALAGFAMNAAHRPGVSDRPSRAVRAQPHLVVQGRLHPARRD